MKACSFYNSSILYCLFPLTVLQWGIESPRYLPLCHPINVPILPPFNADPNKYLIGGFISFIQTIIKTLALYLAYLPQETYFWWSLRNSVWNNFSSFGGENERKKKHVQSVMISSFILLKWCKWVKETEYHTENWLKNSYKHTLHDVPSHMENLSAGPFKASLLTIYPEGCLDRKKP